MTISEEVPRGGIVCGLPGSRRRLASLQYLDINELPFSRRPILP
jgi:hypothetical protein